MFKYSSFSQYSLRNILNDEIYMNHYESFNDPFECRCEILTGFPSINSKSPRLKEIFKAWGFDDVNDSAAIECYDNLVLSLKDSEPNIQAIIDNVRISCFSKREDNLLMWAHYGNGLRGFCLEYDETLILSDNEYEAEIFEVLYDRNPSQIDTAVIATLRDQAEYHQDAIFETENRLTYLKSTEQKTEQISNEIEMYKKHLESVYQKNREIYQLMLANKSIEWKYEEELRIILVTYDSSKKGAFMKYPPESLKSIIIGERMPDKQKETLKKVLEKKENKVKLKLASRIDGQFKVEISDL